MPAPKPTAPCPYCSGRDFVIVERAFLEITDYGRAFDAITCTGCGHTAFFVDKLEEIPTGRRVQVPPGGGPYR